MIPVSGMRPVTPPTMMNAWIAIAAVRPAARSFEKPSSALHRDPQAAVDEDEVEEDHAAAPASPSSWAIAE